MSGNIPAFSDLVSEEDGKSAFEDLVGDGAEFVSGPPPAPEAETLYIDPDTKELFFLDSGGTLCTAQLVGPVRFLLENLSGRIILEDGSGFLRA